MSYAKSGSDLECCYACDRLLAPAEEVYCSSCQSKVLRELDPTDDDLARRDAMISRGYRHLAAILAGATFAAALVFGTLTHVAPTAHAQDTNLTANVGGHTYTWPAIGNDLYTRSCDIVTAFEDGSATAFCSEDGGMYAYDPDGAEDRGIGWYVVSGTR